MAKHTFTADGSFKVSGAFRRCSERLYVQIVATGFTGTVNFKKSIDGAPFADHAYRLDAAGTVATDDLTADAFVSVDASGGMIEVDVTCSVGSVDIYAWIGPSVG